MAVPNLSDAQLANLLIYAHAYIDQHTPRYEGALGLERRRLKDRLFRGWQLIDATLPTNQNSKDPAP